ncbi:MAG: hypothetical protein CVU78_01100 [Elusimicrobia bacterium HGW-Elusimicrobia-2]|nr:MAG: hypothetical protein CVU78_01100 [Elusimicrobia bacterium HGW-Elusimicrobia-2]
MKNFEAEKRFVKASSKTAGSQKRALIPIARKFRNQKSKPSKRSAALPSDAFFLYTCETINLGGCQC